MDGDEVDTFERYRELTSSGRVRWCGSGDFFGIDLHGDVICAFNVYARLARLADVDSKGE